MRERGDVGKTETNEIWDLQRAGASNVAESVAAGVAVVGGVRQRAKADRIEHNPDDAIEDH
jgi:hypothetical protein